MVYDFKAIEKKWQKKWQDEKVFEADADKKRKKFFVTFPYPYVNLSPHIGHFYTIMRVEALARYKRLQGFNVLFPQAWHCTGSPIVSAAERVKENEPKQIELLKKEGFSDKEIKKFIKPEHWIKVFGKIWLKDYKSMGMSVDWRRNFITTSLNPHYDKFVRWQFRKLKEKGYVEKGKHPVVWDPKTNMPVGDHDRIKGEGETVKDFLWVKFRLENSDLIFMSGTTRPDALFGQTNLWLNLGGKYVVVKVGNEKWVVGEKSVERIKDQFNDIKIIKKIDPKKFIGQKVKGPLVNYKIYILPASFIDQNMGSGVVYSALETPEDYMEVKKYHNNPEILKKYGFNKETILSIVPKPNISVAGMEKNLGKAICEEFGAKSYKDRKPLELAKQEINKRVFRKGIMMSHCGKYAKMSVKNAQPVLKKDLTNANDAVMFYELGGEVISRSLTKCVVKIVSDQWFINYGDVKWKNQVHEALKSVKLYPEKVREQFDYVIDWLNDWACTREYGLGTRLPFDENWLIESLSDSTIYMAYYTITHLITKFKINDVDDELFDYVLLGKGKGKEEWRKLKEEFEYWYPLDFRNSGKDLVQNHLTFFLFNHVAIFPKKYWPKSIGVNGWVKVDNEKMSKSIGNIIPMNKMAQKFGADASRLTILNGGEGVDDPNWDSNFAMSLSTKFDNINKMIYDNYNKERKDIKNTDKWAESSMNKIVSGATKFMEETLFRSAIQKIFFDFGNLIKNYLLKTNNNPNKKIFEKMANSYLIMLSVFCPHISEELWHKLGNKNFVSLEKWPVADEKKIDENLEKQEQAVDKLVSDINHVVELVLGKGNKISKAFVYVLPNEKVSYVDGLKLIKKKTGLDVEVYAVNDKDKYDPENKSKKVKPGRPGVYLE